MYVAFFYTFKEILKSGTPTGNGADDSSTGTCQVIQDSLFFNLLFNFQAGPCQCSCTRNGQVHRAIL